MAENRDPREVLGLDWPLVFDEAERELGRDLAAANGGVEILHRDAEAIEAKVRHFDRLVEVVIELDGQTVVAHDCDCPHFDETEKGCEHRWAVLVALAAEVDDEESPNEEEPEAASTEITWLVVGPESERRGRLVVNAADAAGQPLALDLDTWSDVDDEADLRVWRALAPDAGGFDAPRGGPDRGGLRRPRGPWEIAPSRSGALLHAMANTGRLRVAVLRAGSVTIESPTPDEALDLVLRPRQRADGRYELAAYAEGVAGRGPRCDLASAALLTPGDAPWVVVEDRIHPLRAFGAEDWARSLRRGSAPPVERGRFRGMMERLAADQDLPRIATGTRDPAWSIEERPARPVASLRERGDDIVLSLAVDYGSGLEISAASNAELAHDFLLECSVRRDRAREDDARRAVLGLGAEADVDNPQHFLFPGGDLESIAGPLLDAGLRVRVGTRPVRRGQATAVRVESDQDWFRVAGGLSVEGEVRPLGTILDAMGERRGPLVLDEEILVLDPDSRDALSRLAPLAALRRGEEEEMRLDAGQALLADAILGDEVERPESFARARERLAVGPPGAATPVPATLRAELRPYQEAGLTWLGFLDEIGLSGCLADDMGLGKTVQTIAWLLHRRPAARAPFLVVLPRSLVGNWGDELARFAPSLAVRLYDGPRRSLEGVEPGTVVVTTYGIMRRDAETLADTPFDAVVLDEAQAIKNASSATARAARSLVAERRLALSGTPIENDLSELWSLFAFLSPGLLGPQKRFLSAWRGADSGALAGLQRGLGPLILRRRKEEVAPDLPPLIEQTIVCDMSPEQSRLYDELRSSARAELLGGESVPGGTTRVLEALLRLRQVACDPRLVGESEIRSGKTELLLERLDEARLRGDKSIVFSQFTGLLDLVAEELADRGEEIVRLDGRTRDREAPVRRFQDEEAPMVFLISLKAGGTGLNLTAADLVFVLDPWWNPAAEAQAIARAHRIGRRGAVLAQRLVARETVEEQILELQSRKRELADAVLGGEGADLEGMGLEDLELLLHGT